MTVRTFTDIAAHVCEQYRERKKYPEKEDKNLFVKLQEEAYWLYKERFCYTSISQFKSDLTRAINNIRKAASLSKEREEMIQITERLNRKPHLEGSSCFTFTVSQIRQADLNPDSYF
jgi:hypothetical protein